MNNIQSGDGLERSKDSSRKSTNEEAQFEHPISEKKQLQTNDNTYNNKKNSPCSAQSKNVKAKEVDNLFRCGTFIPKSGARAYKTQKMRYTAFFSPQSVYATMRKRKIEKKKSLNPEYTQLRQTYIEWIFELAGKLKISHNSSQLAVNLLDALYYSTTTHNGKLQLYAPTCLLLATKTIELDERIPFITKLRRMANPTYSVDEYKKAELVVLNCVDWNPQYTSILELVEFFLSQGVVFSFDEYYSEDDDKGVLRENTCFANKQNTKVNVKSGTGSSAKKNKENNENAFKNENGDNIAETYKSNVSATKRTTNNSLNLLTTKLSSLGESKIIDLVSKIEATASKLCNYVIKNNEFIETDPVILACACVAYLREIHGVLPRWCQELEELTGIEKKNISELVDQFHKHFDQVMLPEQTFQAPKGFKPSGMKTPTTTTKDRSLASLNSIDKVCSSAKYIFGSHEQDYRQGYTASQTTSLTNIDSNYSGVESNSNSTSKNDLTKSEKAKIFSNPKPLMPYNNNYSDINQAFHNLQPTRHHSLLYNDRHQHLVGTRPNFNNGIKLAPVLIKHHSSNYENSCGSGLPYPNSAALPSDTSCLKATDSNTAWRNYNNILSARHVLSDNTFGFQNKLGNQNKE